MLPEDKLIRGQVWTQDYFPEGWFRGDNQDEGDEEKEEEEGEEEETENFGQSSICYARKDRVLWLAYRLAHVSLQEIYHASLIIYSSTSEYNTLLLLRNGRVRTHPILSR